LYFNGKKSILIEENPRAAHTTHEPNLVPTNIRQRSTLEGNLTAGRNKQPAKIREVSLTAGIDMWMFRLLIASHNISI
jgi:hypothetical protein